jgi:hypothetical protein
LPVFSRIVDRIFRIIRQFPPENSPDTPRTFFYQVSQEDLPAIKEFVRLLRKVIQFAQENSQGIPRKNLPGLSGKFVRYPKKIRQVLQENSPVPRYPSVRPII